MSENAIDNENTGKAPDTAKPKGVRIAGKKAKPAKKAGRAKKPAAKPKSDRANKKTEVIAMMKRAKGATLPEIMKGLGVGRADRPGSGDRAGGHADGLVVGTAVGLSEG